MRFGVTIFFTDESITPAVAARAAEERGFDSIWLPEHTHIPTGRKTPAPMGEPLPVFYRRLLDPLVALSVAASVTTKLRLGTGILLAAQRDPIVTAKAVASLDLVSGGRVELGVGFGWNHDEMEDHGVDPKTRRAQTREHVLAMKALWTEDEASFKGDFVNFVPTWSYPKPVQRPHPPILIGGAPGPKLFDHVIDYADGWIPIGGRGLTKALPELRQAAEERGRDPQSIRVVPFGSIPDPGKLEHFASLGIEEVVIGLSSAPEDVVLPQLDKYAEVIAGA